MNTDSARRGVLGTKGSVNKGILVGKRQWERRGREGAASVRTKTPFPRVEQQGKGGSVECYGGEVCETSYTILLSS